MQWRCSNSCHARAAPAAAEDTCGDRVSADGEWRCRLPSPAWAAGQAPGYYGSWASASGNGEWRRMRCTCCQGRWSWTMSTAQ